MITQAIAIHFFCFLTKAIIPNIRPTIAAGTQIKAQMIVKQSSPHTIASIRLVTDSPDFCSFFFTGIIKILNQIKNYKFYNDL